MQAYAEGILDPAAQGATFLRETTDKFALAAEGAPIDGWIAYAAAGGESLFDGRVAPGTRPVLADRCQSAG